MSKGVAIFKYEFKMFFKKDPPHGLVESFKFLVSHGKKDNIEYLSPQHFRNITVDVILEYKASIIQHQINRQRIMYSRF